MTERRHRVEKKHWSEILKRVHACKRAIDFARQFDTLKEAWDACEEPTWLDWLLKEIRSDRQVPRIVRVAYAEIVYPWRETERAELLSDKKITWTELAKNFEPSFALGCDAIRRVFPNPPRFRNGAGE